jgi:hypothetical protein
MKIRLALFAVALLLLPPLALLIAGESWPQTEHIDGAFAVPFLLSTLAIAALGYGLDTDLHRRKHTSLLRTQRRYVLSLAMAGAGLGVLLGYLNLFVASWVSPNNSIVAGWLCGALLGAVLLPTLLITRLWLASFLLRSLTRMLPLPAPKPEPTASLLLLIALAGLLSGALWTPALSVLFWLSPLLLLLSLQLLWSESTVFTGLQQGDWSRVVLSALSGIVIGTLALTLYRLLGGTLYLATSNASNALVLAVFGLLCVQLGDVIAERLRGKTRSAMFLSKKKFPIPVVVKKD